MTKPKSAKLELTEHEGMLLALLAREEPATAYQLYRIFEDSPVSSINTSKGQLYPAIRRLRERGLVAATKVAGDGRKAEDLRVTPEGLAAVQKWVREIGAAHVVLDNPLRTRMLSLDLLTRAERMEWVARAKALVRAKQASVDEYLQSVSIPYQQSAYQGITETLRVEMEWLDELLYVIVGDE